jgi:hypothetical protein
LNMLADLEMSIVENFHVESFLLVIGFALLMASCQM